MTFTILIDGMFSVGRPQAAKDLLNSFLSHNLVSNVVTYTILMKGLMKKGLLDDVDDLF